MGSNLINKSLWKTSRESHPSGKTAFSGASRLSHAFQRFPFWHTFKYIVRIYYTSLGSLYILIVITSSTILCILFAFLVHHFVVTWTCHLTPLDKCLSLHFYHVWRKAWTQHVTWWYTNKFSCEHYLACGLSFSILHLQNMSTVTTKDTLIEDSHDLWNLYSPGLWCQWTVAICWVPPSLAIPYPGSNWMVSPGRFPGQELHHLFVYSKKLSFHKTP